MANLLTNEHLLIISGTAIITLALFFCVAYLIYMKLRGLFESETKLRAILNNSVDAIGMSTKAGVVVFVNPAYVTLFGYDHSSELIGRPVLDLIAPDQREQITQNISLRVNGGQTPIFYETKGLRKDGTVFEMEVHVSNFELRGEQFTLVIERDITERKQAEEELRASQERFLKVFQNIPSGINIFRFSDKHSIDVNDAYQEITGYLWDEIIGHTAADLNLFVDLEMRNEWIKKLHEGTMIRNQGAKIRRKSGEIRDILVSFDLFEIKGERVGLAVATDITEQKQVEYALEKQNRALQALHKVALDIGSDLETRSLLNQILSRGTEFFDADRGGGIYLFDAEQKILRLEAGSEINKNRIGTILQLNEGVAGRVFQSAQPLIVNDYTNWEGRATVLVSSPSSAVMGVPLTYEGEVFGVLTMVANSERRTFNDMDVHLAEMFAAQAAITIQNTKLYEQAQREISERKQAEEREREQRTLAEALRATAEALNSSLELDEILNKIIDNVEMVVPFDAMNIAWLEDNQVNILRYRGYMLDQKEDTIFNHKFPCEQFPTFSEVIRTCQPLIIPDVQNSPIWRAVPQAEWVRSYVTAPIVIDDKVAGTLNLDSKTPGLYTETHARNLQIFANQVAIAVQNAQLYEKVQYIANYDALTGIPNRRKFMLDTEKELQRARRYHTNVSFVMMDADHFKQVNDTYGHPAGDRALVHLAQILTREIRASDLVGRYGGEEFMLLLPETALDGAKAIAERIRKTVMDTPAVVDGQSIRFTISMGVVSKNAGEDLDFEAMLKQADELLYRAKRAGRNRVMTGSDC